MLRGGWAQPLNAGPGFSSRPAPATPLVPCEESNCHLPSVHREILLGLKKKAFFPPQYRAFMGSLKYHRWASGIVWRLAVSAAE